MFSSGYWFEGEGISSWWCDSVLSPLPTGCRVNGLDLAHALAFETGYVAFSVPGDSPVWSFPPAPRPLNRNVGNGGSLMVAPYWGDTYLRRDDALSFLRCGTVADGSFVVEFHEVRSAPYSDLGMTYQVIVPPGTGDVIRVSYLAGDVRMDGGNAVVGVQNSRVITADGYYNLMYDFAESGPILPRTTLEFHLGTGTSPNLRDSDGDGVDDGDEVARGDDPTSALSGGGTNDWVHVPFYFGDDSGSRSERYRLDVVPVAGEGTLPPSYSWVNGLYGNGETRTASLRPGWKYEVKLCWVECRYPRDGVNYPNYDYTLRLGCASLPDGVVLDDPGGLFREDYHGVDYYGGAHFPILDAAATVTVYRVSRVSVCRPDGAEWGELGGGRVLLDNEDLRVKVLVEPRPEGLARILELFGDTLTLRTFGTCPDGVRVRIPADAEIVGTDHGGEVRLSWSRERLKGLGLLPAHDEDCVAEMSWMDMADLIPGSWQDLSDSEAFARLSYEDRGRASKDAGRTLEAIPPNSVPSSSYFRAAGREIVSAGYGGRSSAGRQIMNQADCFYFSGHGSHATGELQGGLTPGMARGFWDRDLDTVIIAGCSVLDVNDYNGNYEGPDHALSPGRAWERTGPSVLLGYNYAAPGDAGGAPARIMRSWVASRGTLGDVGAWMRANAENRAWNACAIVKDQKYLFFKRKWLRRVVVEIPKGEW